MNTVYIGLGANLDEPIKQLESAIEAIKALPKITIIKVSSFYGSKPMGPQDQPDYVNAVLALTTSLAPLTLLDQLQKIELDAGRVRKDERWGARVLDLDILLFGEQIINNERLTVPHYGMKAREFVIYPLAEIAPELILPCGENIIALRDKIPENGLTVLTKVN